MRAVVDGSILSAAAGRHNVDLELLQAIVQLERNVARKGDRKERIEALLVAAAASESPALALPAAITPPR